MKMKLVAGLTVSLVAGLYVGAMSASADELSTSDSRRLDMSQTGEQLPRSPARMSSVRRTDTTSAS